MKAAREARVDVNDWIESNLGWVQARPILEQLAFPYLKPASAICELGVGTGRWSRHLLASVPDGELVLVDRSKWVVDFVGDYFRASPNVEALKCDGFSLPFEREEWCDLVFSQGMFVTLKLGHMLLYLRHIARTLKPGGRAVFDFIDPGTEEGWAFLERESPGSPHVFAYHRLETVTRCCEAAGLVVETAKPVGKSMFVVAVRG